MFTDTQEWNDAIPTSRDDVARIIDNNGFSSAEDIRYSFIGNGRVTAMRLKENSGTYTVGYSKTSISNSYVRVWQRDMIAVFNWMDDFETRVIWGEHQLEFIRADGEKMSVITLNK